MAMVTWEMRLKDLNFGVRMDATRWEVHYI